MLRSEQHVVLVMVITLSLSLYCLLADATAQSGSAFGQGSGPISLNNVGCTGSETRLVDCSFSNNTVGCTHSNDASATCIAECKFCTLWHLFYSTVSLTRQECSMTVFTNKQLH